MIGKYSSIENGRMENTTASRMFVEHVHVNWIPLFGKLARICRVQCFTFKFLFNQCWSDAHAFFFSFLLCFSQLPFFIAFDEGTHTFFVSKRIHSSPYDVNDAWFDYRNSHALWYLIFFDMCFFWVHKSGHIKESI